MAVVAGHPGVNVSFVAENDEGRNLIEPDPRNRLPVFEVGSKPLDGTAVGLGCLVASHTVAHRRESSLLASSLHPMA